MIPFCSYRPPYKRVLCSVEIFARRHNRLVGSVLFKRLYVLRLCRHKRIMGSF